MNRTCRARELRRNLTDAERALWQVLRDRQVLGYRFRRQAPIGPYIVDFVCFENRLVIEVDGGQHIERAGYDEGRTAWLEDAGFRVIRFWNNEVLEEMEAVRDAVWMAVGGGSPSSSSPSSSSSPPSWPSPVEGEGSFLGCPGLSAVEGEGNFGTGMVVERVFHPHSGLLPSRAERGMYLGISGTVSAEYSRNG